MRDWDRFADCAGWPMTSFFPTDSRDVDPEVLQLCGTCPVRVDCILEVLALPKGEDYGIRGGTTPAQRDELRRLLRREERARPRRKAPHERAMPDEYLRLRRTQERRTA